MLPSPSEVADALLYANTTHCQGQAQCQCQGLCHLHGQCQCPCLCQASITPAPLPVPAPGPVPVPAPAPVPGQQVKVYEEFGRPWAVCEPRAQTLTTQKLRHHGIHHRGAKNLGGLAPSASLEGPDIDPKASRPPVGNKAGTHQSQQDTNHLAYMLKYDTILGKYTGPLRLFANLQGILNNSQEHGCNSP